MTDSSQPAATLTIASGPDAGRRFDIGVAPVTIGRHDQCDIQVEDRWLSRRHACIAWTGNGYVIEDLGSTNGTFVNGERVAGSRALKSGDRLRLGEQVELAFWVSEPAPRPEERARFGAGEPRSAPLSVRQDSFLRRRSTRVWGLALLGLLLVLLVGGAIYYLLTDKGQPAESTPVVQVVLPGSTPETEAASPTPTATPPPIATPTPAPTPTLTPTPTLVVSAGEWIVFASTQGDTDEDDTSETGIYVMRPDGSDMGRVTSYSGSDWTPDLSPDGQTILFVSGRETKSGIHRIGVDGSGPKLLTPSGDTCSDPSWSPDGQAIVFVSDLDDEGEEIYTMTADGSEITRLTDHEFGCRDPAWSPDGQMIAYSCFSKEGGYDIFVVNADGSDSHRITEGLDFDAEPAWSPDGTRIAYSRWDMSNVGEGRGFNIFTLTNSRMFWLLFSGEKASLERLESGIYTMDVDGNDNEALVLTEGSSNWSPAWSPDGETIVFASDRDGDADIYAINLNTLEVKNLTNNDKDDYTPNW